MRLLLVADGFPPDADTGRASAFARVAVGLGRRHAVRLVAGYRRDRGSLPQGALGVELRDVAPVPAQLALWRAARSVARRFRPDVVVASGAWMLPGSVPTVLVVRDLVGTGWEHPSRLMSRVLGWGLRRHTRIVVPTLATWRELRDAGAPEWHLDRIADPVELPDLSDRPSTPGDRTVLVHAGRILPAKGQHLSIDAVSRLSAAEKAEVELHVVGPVGDARYYDQLRVAARDQPVTFETEVETADPWLARADLVLYPTSLPEGFADMAARAQAWARPVVFADHAGVRETLGGVGLPVRPDDPDDLRAAIRAALADPDRRQALGREGRAFVERRYAWDVLAPRWEETLHAAHRVK